MRRPHGRDGAQWHHFIVPDLGKLHRRSPLLPGAEPNGSAVRSKHRKPGRTVGGARSGAQTAWDAGQRAAEAARGARVGGWEQTSRGRFTPADDAAGRTFTNEKAIHVPIATTARNNPKVKGVAEAIMPAGRDQPAATACTIWTLIACKKGSDLNHVRIADPIWPLGGEESDGTPSEPNKNPLEVPNSLATNCRKRSCHIPYQATAIRCG